MSAHCTPSILEYARFFNRQVTARFDGGCMSSNGGAVVLCEVEQTFNLFEHLTQCFTDYRNPRRCEQRAWEATSAGRCGHPTVAFCPELSAEAY